jgi:hypothetical protein
MKMLRIGQSSKAGVRRYAPVVLALTLAVCLGAGTAMAQTVDIDTSGNVDLEVSPGGTVTLQFVFDGTGITTEEVTALGWEVSGLPAGTEIPTDTPANNCEPTVSVNPGPPGAPAVNVKRPEPIILNEGQPNEACNPITTDGSTPFEFFFLVEGDGEGEVTPQPVALPVTVEVDVVIPGDATEGPLTISTVYRYRLDDGAEVNNEGNADEFTVTVADGGNCPTAQGDADGSGSVTPGDAQAVFEQFLGIGPVASPGCAQCDGDAGGNITPGDAQAIFDVFLGAQAMCDGSNG